MKDYLAHHGILGQKWGKRNGPPYPLKGGSYTKTEMNNLVRQRQGKKYGRYNKKHFDQVIKEGTMLQTLARDPNRTDNTDMFYASYTKHDNDRYNALFNHKTEQTLYDENGNEIGTGKTYKWRISNKATKSIKVASRDSGAKAVMDLYENNRDFMNFVRDPNRLQKYVSQMYVPNGGEYARTFKKLQNPNVIPTDRDLKNIYDSMNFVIPNQAKDVVTQRAKLFNALKKQGYSAVLDINDAVNHPIDSNSPIIVFDPSAYVKDSVKQTSMLDVYASKFTTLGRYFLGIYDNDN